MRGLCKRKWGSLECWASWVYYAHQPLYFHTPLNCWRGWCGEVRGEWWLENDVLMGQRNGKPWKDKNHPGNCTQFAILWKALTGGSPIFKFLKNDLFLNLMYCVVFFGVDLPPHYPFLIPTSTSIDFSCMGGIFNEEFM